MPPDGIETLALWREAGEWWQDEPPREVHRFLDANGIRREEIRPLDQLLIGTSSRKVQPKEDKSGSSGIRIRRSRDEKVSLACGNVIAPQYGRKNQEKLTGVAFHTYSGYAYGKGTMIAAEIPAFAEERGY